MTGIELITAERKRQIETEGWTPEHDDHHHGDELAIAAACYATPELYRDCDGCVGSKWPPPEWPWDRKWWRPSPDSRERELVKAGALIAAEIDRLQRLNDRR